MRKFKLRRLIFVILVFCLMFVFAINFALGQDNGMSTGARAAWWFLTAVACLFLGAFELIGRKPKWWQTTIAIVVAISSIIFGKPWALPPGP